METWIADNCLKCKKNNFINIGNPEDCTIPDVEGIECWNCGNKWPIEQEDTLYNLLELNFQVGKQMIVVA